jgi:membrane-bound ClpP family serine protease
MFITKLNNNMNLKRTFGAILSILGIIGLIYTGIGIVNHSSGFTTLTVVGIIAIIFFFTGMSLIRNTSDETK